MRKQSTTPLTIEKNNKIWYYIKILSECKMVCISRYPNRRCNDLYKCDEFQCCERTSFRKMNIRVAIWRIFL